jgi:hypothetical protein
MGAFTPIFIFSPFQQERLTAPPSNEVNNFCLLQKPRLTTPTSNEINDLQLSIMHKARLNDTAIALSRILDKQPIYFGFFGGYAINAYGGQRECKDIDCLADATKQQIINVLDGKEGFVKAPIQTSEDYVAFLWSEQPNRQNPVLVEIWCDQFPGKFIRSIPFLSFNQALNF